MFPKGNMILEKRNDNTFNALEAVFDSRVTCAGPISSKPETHISITDQCHLSKMSWGVRHSANTMKNQVTAVRKGFL